MLLSTRMRVSPPVLLAGGVPSRERAPHWISEFFHHPILKPDRRSFKPWVSRDSPDVMPSLVRKDSLKRCSPPVLAKIAILDRVVRIKTNKESTGTVGTNSRFLVRTDPNRNFTRDFPCGPRVSYGLGALHSRHGAFNRCVVFGPKRRWITRYPDVLATDRILPLGLLLSPTPSRRTPGTFPGAIRILPPQLPVEGLDPQLESPDASFRPHEVASGCELFL